MSRDFSRAELAALAQQARNAASPMYTLAQVETLEKAHPEFLWRHPSQVVDPKLAAALDAAFPDPTLRDCVVDQGALQIFGAKR
jgi:hypothetical protein